MIIGGVRPGYFLKLTNFVLSVPYMQDDLTWCVSHAKAIPRWKNIYYIPQDATIYTWGALMYIMTIIGAFLLTTFEEKPLDFWYCAILSTQTVVGFSSTFKPKGSLMRFHYGQFLIIPFWLTQIFSAFLIIFLPRILYENQINTVETIARNGFRLAGDSNVLNHLNIKSNVSINFTSFFFLLIS